MQEMINGSKSWGSFGGVALLHCGTRGSHFIRGENVCTPAALEDNPSFVLQQHYSCIVCFSCVNRAIKMME